MIVPFGDFLNFGLRRRRLEGGASRQTSLEAARKKDECSFSSRWKEIGVRCRRTRRVDVRSSPAHSLPPRNSSVPCTPAAQNDGFTPGGTCPVRRHSGQGRRTRNLFPRILTVVRRMARRAIQTRGARGLWPASQYQANMHSGATTRPSRYGRISGRKRSGCASIFLWTLV